MEAAALTGQLIALSAAGDSSSLLPHGIPSVCRFSVGGKNASLRPRRSLTTWGKAALHSA